eukprot:4194439-Ditylum_brightwellii.AAC.1
MTVARPTKWNEPTIHDDGNDGTCTMPPEAKPALTLNTKTTTTPSISNPVPSTMHPTYPSAAQVMVQCQWQQTLPCNCN